MQVKDVLVKTTQFFKDKGYSSPRLDTELLIASALKWERMKIYLNYEYPLTEDELTRCRELVRRRASGEPVAYILGYKDFFKHAFKVNAGVLIPRPETEGIVEEATTWAKSQSDVTRVVDLGVGSGCLGLSILAELADTRLLGLDISPEAVSVSRENAETMGLSERVEFMLRDAATLGAGDVVTALGGLADLVVSNPPYIAENDPEVEANVRKWEPAQALFAPDNGLGFVRTWAEAAATIARPGAFIMFEIGYQQGAAAKEIFESMNRFRDVEIIKDLSGFERFIRCFRIEAN